MSFLSRHDDFDYKVLKKDYEALQQENRSLKNRLEVAMKYQQDYEDMMAHTKELQEIMNGKIENLTMLENEMQEYIDELKNEK